MVTKKLFKTINEVQEIQRLATECAEDVGLHSEDGNIIIDAKSYIGLYALDFKEPVLVVCEDENFHKLIKDIGKTV